MSPFLIFLAIFVVVILAAAVLTLRYSYIRWAHMEPGCVVYVLKPGCESPESMSDYIPAKIVNYATALGEVEDRWTKAYCADDLSYHLFKFWDVHNLRVITPEQYDCLDEILLP